MVRKRVIDGRRVEELREEALMDREQMARSLGITSRTLLRIERGPTRKPDRKTTKAMAELLGVDHESLWRWDDDNDGHDQGGLLVGNPLRNGDALQVALGPG